MMKKELIGIKRKTGQFKFYSKLRDFLKSRFERALPSRKQTVRDWLKVEYVEQRNRISKGYGEFSTWLNFLKLYLLLEISFSVVPFLKIFQGQAYLIVLAVVICWFAGWLWDKVGMFHIEDEWGTLRSPYRSEMRAKHRK